MEEMLAEGWDSHWTSAWLRWLKFFEGERGHILLGCTWLVPYLCPDSDGLLSKHLCLTKRQKLVLKQKFQLAKES